MEIKEILNDSPVCDCYGEQYAFYSVNCCWWTSFPEDLGETKTPPIIIENTDGSKEPIGSSALPCCPHCRSILMQAPLKEFIQNAKDNESHYGSGGLDTFLLAHHRNSDKCYRGWKFYEKEAGNDKG